MSKERRQRLIRRVLDQSPVRSQEDLQAELATKGVAVAQPTLSRDLRELGVVKGPNGYVLPENGAVAVAERDTFGEAAELFVESVESSGQMVVIRTGPGRSQPIAVELDALGLPDALGTIAGDDTIFVVAPSDRAAERLADFVRNAAGIS